MEASESKLPSAGHDYPRDIRVLMVEDNDLNRFVARQLMKKIGWDLDTARNGIEAVEMVKNNRYDVVLMDIQMPEMNGIEATQKIRNELKGAKAETPIIACTPQTTELKQWLAAGMNDYISKPFDTEELIAKVSRLLKKKGDKENSVSETGDNSASSSGEEEDVINLKNLYTYSGNSHDTVKSIIDVFMMQTPKQMETLTSLVLQKDWSSVKVLSHKLKSSFALIGANSVREILQTMEDNCSRNPIDETLLNNLLYKALSLNTSVINRVTAIAAS